MPFYNQHTVLRTYHDNISRPSASAVIFLKSPICCSLMSVSCIAAALTGQKHSQANEHTAMRQSCD